jgi:uncharacterized protein YjbJ (UPF0337 family)
MTGMTRANVVSVKLRNDRSNTMKSGTRDEAEGKWHKVKGKVKEIAGELSDDPKLEAEGANEKIAGKFRKDRRSRRSLGRTAY